MLVLAFSVFMGWALWRRFDFISIMLALFMASTISLWDTTSNLPALITTLETIFVVSMALALFHWFKDSSLKEKAQRAQLIGIIGCCKIVIWLIFVGASINWYTGALLNNIGLAFQILIAGGVGHGALDRLTSYFINARNFMLCRLGYGKAC